MLSNDHPSTYTAKEMSQEDLLNAYRKLYSDYDDTLKVLRALIVATTSYPS